MRSAARLLDAAFNRATEAARVLEDIARFTLDSGELTEQYKQLRHEIARVAMALPAGWREANREVPADVGTHLEGSAESARSGIAAMVDANASRLAEALRSLEEALKLPLPAAVANGGSLAQAVKALRYRAYAMSALLSQRIACATARQWKVCLLLTESICKLDWRTVLEASLGAGVDCVQVREKGMDTASLLGRVREVTRIAHAHGASVIVNDRVDVALAGGADGVHLGSSDMPLSQARAIAAGSLFVGATVHDAAEAARAIDEGADYFGVGPMFASELKPSLSPAGPAWIRQFVQRWPGSIHLAIGGINSQNTHELATAGCKGVAVSTAICASTDPAGEVTRIRGALA